jgi:hypothetical protein
MAGLKGLKRLQGRVAIARYERAQQRREQACQRSHIMVGAYGLAHLDEHGASSRSRVGARSH